MPPEPIPRGARIYIAGHRGLVGAGLWRHFSERGFVNLTGRSSSELDLRDRRATAAFFEETRPDVVIDAAARVGGIAANDARPTEFLSDNLRIQLNLLDCAVSAGVPRLLFLGSSCIYPKLAEQPIREEALLSGHLEESNEAYAIAKLAGVVHVKSIRREHRLPYISAMPASIYGPGDNFAAVDSHVLPAMLRRFHGAARSCADHVTCWGTGSPRREFLYVDDLADACHFLLDNYDDASPVNVGSGVDVTIAELARLVADVVGFEGEIRWDETKPDGVPRKTLDVSRLAELGWRATTPFAEGVKSTYEWFLEHQHDFRA